MANLRNEFIHCGASLDHEHDPARPLEQRDEFRDGMRAEDFGPPGFVLEKGVDLFHRAIKDGHGKTVIVHIEDEILAHDSQSDQSDICLSFHKIASLI